MIFMNACKLVINNYKGMLVQYKHGCPLFNAYKCVLYHASTKVVSKGRCWKLLGSLHKPSYQRICTHFWTKIKLIKYSYRCGRLE